ncbi:metal ABC transporter solute-binding protein, Zn/Mn family [Macrococcus equipercicus]|uniref:ABC transporter substrate-binding protein n=1 Tax=Macrococcus equipercicus TaxID=69967 RepID=A0A9Q9F259_9STAP|nr:zinc ABC transporter substrate-binding protein [Macrococcus equipercicus]KAA1040315.1 ABC transporter substrate-binding protein [Macrococcus equipercicus]UTH14803.1 zinc ABC transporter substrate-binding protein [Macrococcus equipercicus]
MKRIIFLVAALLLTLAGCNQQTSIKSEKMQVYTTVFPLKSFIEQIGGNHVAVTSIYPNGIDVHTYEPTQKDTLAVAKSDLFVYTGDELDPIAGKMAKVVKDKKKLLAVAADIKSSELLKHDHDEAHEEHEHESTFDPHVWLDPVLDQSFARKIKDELIAKDPAHKKDYEKNYQSLKKDLQSIDSQLKDITKHPKRDTVYISHDSLGYLADHYHFNQVGVSGMNNDEPSQNEIVHMINDIKASKTPYIIYEQNISSKITDIIKDDTNAKPLKFHNMAVLTNQDKDATYQSLMKQNIKTLDSALNK